MGCVNIDSCTVQRANAHAINNLLDIEQWAELIQNKHKMIEETIDQVHELILERYCFVLGWITLSDIDVKEAGALPWDC